MSAPDPIEQHLSLSGYLAHIQKAIRAAVPESSWVVAELSDFKRRPNGHCYMDILESSGGAEVAKARCTMFANVAGKVLAQWQQATGGLPQAGMNVLLKVRADFSPQFGFSLMVTGIDPSYTIGDMQAKVQKIVTSLKERQWFDLQRDLAPPSGFWRVAVVAPHEAAGLADFRRDAEQLAAADVCGFEYYSATFQGRDASDSIRSALRSVHERHLQTPFDAVCIIRGGGLKATWPGSTTQTLRLGFAGCLFRYSPALGTRSTSVCSIWWHIEGSIRRQRSSGSSKRRSCPRLRYPAP